MATNQSNAIGPNTRPTLEEPLNWMTKRPVSSPIVIGATRREKIGPTTSSPSTAESTLIAGVIIPSPISSPAPTINAQRSRRARRSARACNRP